MSNQVNQDIRERAMEVAEEATNSMLGAQLEDAIKHDDLERMQSLTLAVERHLNFMELLNDEVQ